MLGVSLPEVLTVPCLGLLIATDYGASARIDRSFTTIQRKPPFLVVALFASTAEPSRSIASSPKRIAAGLQRSHRLDRLAPIK